MKKRYILLFIIPIISLIILWTNDWHHLFYEHYSVNLDETTYGPYKVVHDIYSYLMLLIGIFYMLRVAYRNSGFFSKQSLLIVAGVSIPVIINVLGTLKIIPMTIYVTPITFTIALLFFTFAIFKFKFLGVTPIALRTIVDRISDSYIVLSDDFTITDFNATLLKTFKLSDEDIREKNIINFFNTNKKYDMNIKKLENAINTARESTETITFEQHLKSLNKYFTVEVNTLYNKDNFLGILILFKDITQHKIDMKTIRDNQDMLMERERLASLGQLIGGVSHNLKTPIMSISGATEGINDLITEFDKSIGDPEVTNDDFHEIASDMRDWITKINSYTSYMSDIITAVKGQAVTLSESEQETFTVEELIKRVNILMKNELQSGHARLNIQLNDFNDVKIHGNVNSLVQVVNNLLSNAIQSYRGQPNGIIDLSTLKRGKTLTISVEDHGCGMPKDVQKKLFKEMITTKGKNGTGLDMFMSYSTIKGKFNGDITFETKENVGTKFNIILPID